MMQTEESIKFLAIAFINYYAYSNNMIKKKKISSMALVEHISLVE